MTLRLVELDIANLNDIPGACRKLADDIEAGEYGDVKTVIGIINSTDALFTETFGECPNRFQAVGIMEFAKDQMFDE